MKTRVFHTITLMTVVMIAMLCSGAEARRYVGFWLGSGVTFPSGDFKMGEMGGDAGMGPRLSIGIDFYAQQNLSIGIFGGIDGPGAGDRAVIISPDWMYGDPIVTKVKNYGVFEAGGMIKYFFGQNPSLEPYGKLWYGVSATSINAEYGSADGKAGAAYGAGIGAMIRLLNQIRLSADINYNHSKMDKNDGGNSSRINLGIALNFLFGS